MDLAGKPCFLVALLVALFSVHFVESGYSSSEDARVLSAFRQRFIRPRNHAKVARKLVHTTNWAAVGSISTDKKLKDFPMVNVVSISDSADGAPSTGMIYFVMTDLDFTGKDWRKNNKVTFLLTSEQRGNCSEIDVDPMEPICWRALISGKIIEIEKDNKQYEFGWNAFVSRHPATSQWIRRHDFYLCVLDIEHIYVLDWYGGAKDVSVKDYYKVKLEEDSADDNTLNI